MDNLYQIKFEDYETQGKVRLLEELDSEISFNETMEDSFRRPNFSSTTLPVDTVMRLNRRNW